MGKPKHADDAQLINDLGERVKELECLYGIARIEDTPDLSSSQIYQRIVDLIPAAWQYPDITCARITVNDQEFRTVNFKKARWRQSEDVLLSGSVIGAVDVYYLKKKPEAGEGPFLKEERALIEEIAGRLGKISRARQSVDKIKNLAKFPSENPFPVLRIKKDGKIIYANDATNSLLAKWGSAVDGLAPDFLRKLTSTTFRSKKVRRDILVNHENRILSFIAVPILDSGYVDFYGLDVTQNKKREDRLELLSQAVESVSYGIQITDLNGKFIYTNEASSKLTGYTKQEYLGMSATEIPPDPNETREVIIPTVMKTGQWDDESVVKRKDGSLVPIWLTISIAKDANGKPMGLVSTAKDISDIKKAGEDLQKSEEWSRNMIESAQEGIWVLDKDSKTTFINDQMSKILGYAENEMLGKSILDFMDADAKKDAVYYMKRREEGVSETHDFRLMNKSGGNVWVLISTTPLLGADGEFQGAFGMVTDITDRKHSEDLLQESEERYRTLVDSSAEHICQVDLKGKFLFMNPTGLRDHNINSLEDLKGVNQIDLVEPPYRKLLKDALKVGKTGVTQEFEYESETISGIRWFKSVLTPIKGKSSKIISFIRLSSDITDRKQRDLMRRATEEKLRHTVEGAVKALSSMTALRDPYTVGHQERVSKLACAIGDELGFSQDRVEGLRTATDLHDVGKVHVPAEILTKPGKINEYEFKLIQYHAQAGFDILRDIDFPWPVAEMVLQHHERLNGSGYPQGLSGNSILEEARIIAVADVVEAMSSRRPYRAGLGIEEALKEISKNRGILYDPKVVDICLRLFREKGFDFRSEKREKAA